VLDRVVNLGAAHPTPLDEDVFLPRWGVPARTRTTSTAPPSTAFLSRPLTKSRPLTPMRPSTCWYVIETSSARASNCLLWALMSATAIPTRAAQESFARHARKAGHVLVSHLRRLSKLYTASRMVATASHAHTQ
jgi:hypothetical protein